MGTIQNAGIYILKLRSMLQNFNYQVFDKVVSVLEEVRENEHRIFIMGNGGSAATASHLACDLAFVASRNSKKPFRVTCLNDSIPIMLAISNDISYNMVFADQLKGIVDQWDVVIGISGSGNSLNILQALRYANTQHAFTIGLTGKSGGVLKNLCHYTFQADSDDMQKIEDMHLIFCHMLMQAVMEKEK